MIILCLFVFNSCDIAILCSLFRKMFARLKKRIQEEGGNVNDVDKTFITTGGGPGLASPVNRFQGFYKCLIFSLLTCLSECNPSLLNVIWIV